MNKDELMKLIETGEGYTIEFKESLNSSIGKDICAFANASGGKIILGVKDDGTIKGYKLSNADRSKIIDIAKNMEPRFYVNVEQVDDLAVIHVPEGKEKPYFVNGHCYIRQGASSILLRRNDILEFFQRENLIQFDKKANKDFDIERDFNERAFQEFVERAGIPKGLSKEHILRNLNLLTNGTINNAGVLFFCKDLKKFFLNAGIVVVLYRSTNKSDIMDIKEFYDDFVTNYENVMKYVLLFLNKNIEIKGIKRQEKLEIPEEALREAIINAMVHRDYFIQGRVQIDIYPDRLEISNPGKLLFDKSELGKVSVARNPILFDLAHRLGYIEKVGSGIQRIRKLVPNVKFEITSDWFRVIFPRTVEKSEKWSEKWSDRWSEKWSELSERQRQILKLIIENPKISRAKLSEILGINPSAVQKHLEKLKSLGLIKRVGPDKGGYWEVLRE